MRKYYAAEGATMPAAENDKLAIEVAELRSDVRHIQSDVTDIKASIRATDQRLEAFRRETDQKFESFRKDFDSIKESLASAKLWAFGLYVTGNGALLYVMARGFKWL